MEHDTALPVTDLWEVKNEIDQQRRERELMTERRMFQSKQARLRLETKKKKL